MLLFFTVVLGTLALEDKKCSVHNLDSCIATYVQQVADGTVKDDRQQPWNIPALYVEDSIYQRDSAFDVFRRVHFPTDGLDKNENQELRQTYNEIFAQHRPSRHSFFSTLKNAPREVATNPHVLREIYIRYQAAMHSTRVAVYFSPYLDSPQLRQRKAKIILDDDTVNELPSHHKQLENLFRSLGAQCIPHEEEFGTLPELRARVDPDTARFIKRAEEFYRSDGGAWTTVEILSDDWISAFSQSFAPHYEAGFVLGLQYFDEITTGHVEIQHMLETLALLEDTIARYPRLLPIAQEHSREMAKELDLLWESLEGIVKNPSSFFTSMIPESESLRTCDFFRNISRT